MKIDTLVLGDYQTNCYILSKEDKCLVIDPGNEVNKIINYIEDNKLKLLYILVTHHHFDHVGALKELKNKYKVEVIDYNNQIKINDFNFDIIETLGHTNDSITFYFKEEKVMFTGDFLFRESIGRYDFPNSNKEDMIKSIELIKKYPKDITIYSGHGKISTLEHEFKYNYFLN